MSIGSRLKIESKGMFATLVFYAAAGIIFLVAMPVEDFQPQLGILGVFSLIAAYGMFKKRNWTIWFIVVLFFTAATFSALMLNYSYLKADYVLGVVVAVYLILTLISTAYTMLRRKLLET